MFTSLCSVKMRSVVVCHSAVASAFPMSPQFVSAEANLQLVGCFRNAMYWEKDYIVHVDAMKLRRALAATPRKNTIIWDFF